MANTTEIVKGDRKILISNDFLPLYGAVLGTMAGKPNGLTRFGVLRDGKVTQALAARGIHKETAQVMEIDKVFTSLQGKGMLTVSSDKSHLASIVSEYNDLAKEVAEVAGKIVLPAPTAKRGRPAGSGGKSQGSVKRNPAPTKAKRFSLVNGKVVAWTIGKPSKDQRLTECDEKGKIIADIAAINAMYAAKEAAKSMKVKRNPKQAANLRYYLHNGEVTPFGRGKPSFDKLNNECTQAGEKIDNSARLAAMRQPSKSGGGNSSKVSQLEAQLTEMREMMAKMMLAMGAGAAVAAAPAVAAATEVPAKVQEKVVEPAKPAKVKEEKPKAEKPVKSKPSKPSKPKVEKVKASAKLDADEDAYEAYAKVSNEFDDDEPIAFDTDGFVVTDID